MVGQHHRLNGHEFEQTPGDGEGQESLAGFSLWGRRVGYDLAGGTEPAWETFPKEAGHPRPAPGPPPRPEGRGS